MATSCVWEFQHPHLSWQLSESVRSWLVGLKRCVTVVRFGFAFPCWIMLPASFYILTGHLYIFGGMSIWIPATSKFGFFGLFFIVQVSEYVSIHILLTVQWSIFTCLSSQLHFGQMWTEPRSDPSPPLEPGALPGKWVGWTPGLLMLSGVSFRGLFKCPRFRSPLCGGPWWI